MINLNDVQAIIAQAGKESVESIQGIPEQVEAALDIALRVKFPDRYRDVDAVVACGMGGSRTPILILEHLFKELWKVPFVVNNDYTLPGWVTEKTLVILSSYSGTTEEPIACATEAIAKGCRVTAVGVGREGIDLMKEHSLPYVQFSEEFNPSLQPRNGTGYTMGGSLGILLHLGLLDYDVGEMRASLARAKEAREDFSMDVPVEHNLAKQFALALHERYPYIVVSEFLYGVGNGMQNQINETAKAISSLRIIPEINHHLLEGLKFTEDHRQIATFLFCDSPLYLPQNRKRFIVTKEVVEQNGVRTLWIETKGETKLDHALYLMGFGGYLSVYLSALYGENPNVIPYVDYFKKRMKE